MTRIRLALLWTTLAALLVGCPDDVPHTADTDSDTNGQCVDFERTPFELNQVEALCEFVLACPDSGLANVEECTSNVLAQHQASGCWDACVAEDCVLAVAALAGECESVFSLPEACNQYFACD